MPNYVTVLHNYFQERKESNLLSWVESSSGPSNEAIWTVQCKIAGTIRGIGEGTSKMEAKQAAAQQALNALGVN